MPDECRGHHITGTEFESLADIGHAIAADTTLPDWRRKSVACSLRCFARLYGGDLESMPPELGAYRPFIKDFHPTKAGIKKSRWTNIKSDIGFAFRRVGLKAIPGRSLHEMSFAWKVLYDRLPGKGYQCALSRFFRYCSAQGITPEQVSEKVTNAFLQALIEESFAEEPERPHRRMLVYWNRAVREIPGWPQTVLEVPDRRNWWVSPWSAFPRSLQDEVDRWNEQTSGHDFLAEDGPARPLAATTLERRDYNLRVFASALVLSGQAPDSLTSLTDLADGETLKAGLKYLFERNGARKTTQIYQIALLVRGVARDWLKRDAEQIKELDAICGRLNPQNSGLTDKNRERLRQFDDPRNVALLVNFPATQLAKARRSYRDERTQAVAVQTAVAVEILLMTATRLGNLVRLDVNRHIQWSRSGRKGVAHFVIPGEEVKNGEPLEFELPVASAKLLSEYLKTYHPRLTRARSLWLFPGRNGNHKHPNVLRRQITDAVLDETGIEINPHLFRHLGAKLYLDANPGHYEDVRRLLGHKSINTTTGFYTGLETAAAVRRFNETILKLRRSDDEDDPNNG